jgi:hypothetical protein
MAKRGQSAWNRKFGQIAKECFRSTKGDSMRSYGSCMATELRKASGKRGGGRRKKHKR